MQQSALAVIQSAFYLFKCALPVDSTIEYCRKTAASDNSTWTTACNCVGETCNANFDDLYKSLPLLTMAPGSVSACRTCARETSLDKCTSKQCPDDSVCEWKKTLATNSFTKSEAF